MPAGGWKTALACCLLGSFCFTLLPWIEARTAVAYWQKEPIFLTPIPVPPEGLTLRSDSYGKGFYGASRNGGRKHLGVDLSLEVGSPVFASKSGRVIFAGFDKGYGFFVKVAHQDGFSTRYAHLSKLFVANGDWIPQGALLGMSGKSGNANHPQIKPHLHFEIRYLDKPLNPQEGWVRNIPSK